MPIIKSAKKAARQATKRTAHNQQIKKDIKTALKEFKKNPTAENMKKIQSEYDKAAKKGLMKKNTVSRRKAALAKIAKAAGVKPSASVKKDTKAPAKKAATATKKTTTKKPAAKKTPSKSTAKAK